MTSEPVFTLSRTFAAPREEVFRAFTDPEWFRGWWGPVGMPVTSCAIGLRPGGTCLFSLDVPGGEPMWARFVFEEVEAPSRLVLRHGFSDADGGITRQPGAPDWPEEIRIEWRFADEGGGTRFDMRAVPIDPTPAERAAFVAELDGMREGFGGSFDQLEPYLASRR